MNLAAKYEYDAWGNHTVTEYSEDNIGALNPIRYRGYYYDRETGLYYLKSRYYDPETGRFINADDPSVLDLTSGELNRYNLYAYCYNNPVMMTDSDGNISDGWRIAIGVLAILGAIAISLVTAGTAAPVLIGLAIGSVIGGGFEIGKQLVTTGEVSNWGAVGWATFGGAVAGAVSAIPIPGLSSLGAFGKAASYGLTFVVGGSASVLGGIVSGTVSDFKSGLVAFAIGGVANVIARGISEKIASLKASKIYNQGNKAKSLDVQKLQSHKLNMGG
jgi:RHS repeat-associated protein